MPRRSRDDLRDYVTEAFADPDAVLVIAARHTTTNLPGWST